MSATLVARRYAKALFKIADNDVGKASAFVEPLACLNQMFELPDSGKILRNPVMPADLKRNLLDYALEVSKAGDEFRKFVTTVIDSGRVMVIPEIVATYNEILQDAKGVVTAEITSASDLDQVIKDKIAATVATLLGKKVDVSAQVDPDILGGFVVEVGNFKIDMSLKTKIDELSQAAGTVH